MVKIFQQLDKDDSMSLNRTEINPYIKSHAEDDVTALRVKHVLKTIDMNSDKFVSRIEFYNRREFIMKSDLSQHGKWRPRKGYQV